MKKYKRNFSSNKKVRFQDTDYLFDDCAICQYVKEMGEKGKPQAEETLKKAFQKAKEKGAAVSGSIFEQDEKRN